MIRVIVRWSFRDFITKLWRGNLADIYRKTIWKIDRYGGRGIKICKEWMDVTNFAAWLLVNGYNENMTIDRININGDYEPNNCRLLTFSENSSLTRNTHWLEAFGEKKTIAQWLKDPRCKAKSGTLYSRWKYLGWSAEDAIATPPNEGHINGENHGRISYICVNVQSEG